MNVRLSAIAASASLLLGCPEVTDPPPSPNPDAQTEGDAGGVERIDTDGDGLCDDTELAWGTLVEEADSDGDGFNDRIERDLGFFPLLPDSPDRESLLFLTENEASSVQLSVVRTVRGLGESYLGGFTSLPTSDRLGVTARSFLQAAVAVGAMPDENVAEVVAEEQRFTGVVGRTQLFFEVRFGFGDELPRGCGRVFPFRYTVKRDDGTTFLNRRYLIVVTPRSQRLENIEWCVAEGGCI